MRCSGRRPARWRHRPRQPLALRIGRTGARNGLPSCAATSAAGRQTILFDVEVSAGCAAESFTTGGSSVLRRTTPVRSRDAERQQVRAAPVEACGQLLGDLHARIRAAERQPVDVHFARRPSGDEPEPYSNLRLNSGDTEGTRARRSAHLRERDSAARRTPRSATTAPMRRTPMRVGPQAGDERRP